MHFVTVCICLVLEISYIYNIGKTISINPQILPFVFVVQNQKFIVKPV